MTTTARIPGLRGEFLWELDIATRQVVGLANAIPADRYSWRPDPQARSVSEVFVHIAAGIFMLLDFIGMAPPLDIYADLPDGQERMMAFVRRNDELELSVCEKDKVQSFLNRSLNQAAECLTGASEAELERPLHFFGEPTTVRRAYLRLLAHTHEHMGQMIAYLRCNGIEPPWPDWRPDRRH